MSFLFSKSWYYLWIHIHTHTHIHIHIYTHLHIHMYAYVCVGGWVMLNQKICSLAYIYQLNFDLRFSLYNVRSMGLIFTCVKVAKYGKIYISYIKFIFHTIIYTCMWTESFPDVMDTVEKKMDTATQVQILSDTLYISLDANTLWERYELNQSPWINNRWSWTL